MKKQLTILAAVLSVSPAFSQSTKTFDQWSNVNPMPDPRFVVSSQGDCLALGLKKHLLDGQITRFAVSPHGKYAVAQRVIFTNPQYFEIFAGKNPEPLKERLTLVSSTTGRTVDLPVDPTKASIDPIAILDSGAIFATINAKDSNQTVIFSPAGQMSIVNTVHDKNTAFLTPDALRLGASENYVLVVYAAVGEDNHYTDSIAKCVLVNPKGQVYKDLTNLLTGVGRAATDSVTPNVLYVEKNGYWFTLNLTSGQITPFDNTKPEAALSDIMPRLKTSAKYSDDGSSVWTVGFDEGGPASTSPQTTTPKAEPASPVIGVNLGQAYVADDQSAVFLTDTGGLDVIPLQPVDLAVYNAMLKRKAQNEAMTKAKVVSLGMLMYGADWDDTLPMSNNWSDAVMPYLKNKDLVTNFQYLGDGENMKDVKDPAKTELGIISTPYGEAIAYLDGHVVWRDNNSGGLCLTILAPYSKPNPDLLNPQPTQTLIDPDSAKETPREAR